MFQSFYCCLKLLLTIFLFFFWSLLSVNNQRMVQVILNVVLVCLMAYITAVMEAVTISKVTNKKS